MTAKEPSVPESNMMIGNGSEQSLAFQYAELLRLRQAVRLAEFAERKRPVRFSRPQSELN
jgi:hypothetical protein